MKAKKLLFLLGVGATLLSTTAVIADDLNARAIMEKVDARDEVTL